MPLMMTVPNSGTVVSKVKSSTGDGLVGYELICLSPGGRSNRRGKKTCQGSSRDRIRAPGSFLSILVSVEHLTGASSSGPGRTCRLGWESRRNAMWNVHRRVRADLLPKIQANLCKPVRITKMRARLNSIAV